MANHCYNYITFWNDDDDISPIKKMIEEAIAKNEMGEGWLPDMDIDLPYPHWLFDVEIVGETEESITIVCWTKWEPPVSELEWIGRKFRVGIDCDYDELSNFIYGIFHYNPKTDVVTNDYLKEEDFARVEYNEEKDVYIFNGEEYESEYELYDEMLTEKTR